MDTSLQVEARLRATEQLVVGDPPSSYTDTRPIPRNCDDGRWRAFADSSEPRVNRQEMFHWFSLKELQLSAISLDRDRRARSLVSSSNFEVLVGQVLLVVD